MNNQDKPDLKNNNEIAREKMTEAKDSRDLAFDPDIFPRVSPVPPMGSSEFASDLMPKMEYSKQKNYDLASDIMPSGDSTTATHMHKNRFRSK